MYVQSFKSPTEIAEALLADQPVVAPAHRSEGPSGRWVKERRYGFQDVGSRIDEDVRRRIEAAAMRDLTECGRLMRNALQHAAAELACELFREWCREDAA